MRSLRMRLLTRAPMVARWCLVCGAVKLCAGGSYVSVPEVLLLLLLLR